MKTVMAHLGHASLDAAMRYQHARDDRVAADAMDKAIATAETSADRQDTAASGTPVARQHGRRVTPPNCSAQVPDLRLR